MEHEKRAQQISLLHVVAVTALACFCSSGISLLVFVHMNEQPESTKTEDMTTLKRESLVSLISACQNATTSLDPASPTNDNTARLQAAITALGQAGGGVAVLDAGCFYFTGSIAVPSGVTLRGSFANVPSHNNVSSPFHFDGTFLLPLANKGNESATAFISLTVNSGIQGLVIYYPEQEHTNMPIPFPYSIAMSGNNAFVTDVELLNSYLGISAVGAHRHYIARVQGQPFKIGIFVDETYDIGRIEDVHFNPWYSASHPLIEYQLVHGRAFVFGRSDWEYVLNTFAFGYAVGYHFIHTSTGDMNGNFVGIGADLAINASVLVDAAQAPGILITNGEFTAFHTDGWLPGSTVKSAHVVVSDSNTGPVQFVGSSFWGAASQIARLSGSGTATFSNCQFLDWGAQGDSSNTSAIQLMGGNAIIQGNFFHKDANQMTIDKGAGKVVFMGNMGAGAQRVIGQDQASVYKDAANAFDEEIP